MEVGRWKFAYVLYGCPEWRLRDGRGDACRVLIFCRAAEGRCPDIHFAALPPALPNMRPSSLRSLGLPGLSFNYAGPANSTGGWLGLILGIHGHQICLLCDDVGLQLQLTELTYKSWLDCYATLASSQLQHLLR